jgi:hypothetical protein
VSLVYSGLRSVKVRDANRWFEGQDRYCLVVDQRCSRGALMRPRLSQAFDLLRLASQSTGECHDTLRPLYDIRFLLCVRVYTHMFLPTNPLCCQAPKRQFNRRDARHTTVDDEQGSSRTMSSRLECPVSMSSNGNRVAFRFVFVRQPRLNRDQHSPHRVQEKRSRRCAQSRCEMRDKPSVFTTATGLRV